MNKADYTEDHPHYVLFYGDKTVENHWYTEEANGNKTWDQEKVAHFWETLRQEKMANKDYDFSAFFFPEFAKENFWLEKDAPVFEEAVTFVNAQFAGRTFFHRLNDQDKKLFLRSPINANDQALVHKRVVFKKEAYFEAATFTKEANFNAATFTKEANFDEAIFTEEANFISATFTKEANFNAATFTKEANFDKAFFTEELNIIWATFTEGANFYAAAFIEGANFYAATFTEEANFMKATFTKAAYFDEATFTEGASFTWAIFTKEANFDAATFTKESVFYEATFTEEASFEAVTLKGKLFFIDINCISGGFIRFFNINFEKEVQVQFQIQPKTFFNKKPCPVIFEECIFSPLVKFLDSDFRHVSFKKCELVDAVFSNCSFGKEKFRTKFQNEDFQYEISNSILTLKHVKDALTVAERLEHYKMVMEVYRQLKKNQKDAQDWAEAGDAYRSEMVLKRKVFWLRFIIEKKVSLFFNWLIIGFHGVTSAYQQSMTRPLGLLVVLWFVFSIIFYGNQHNPFAAVSYESFTEFAESSEQLLKEIHFNGKDFKSAMTKSFYAAFPFSGSFQPDDPLKLLMVIERILSTILLTFFGIATRARLKQ